METNYIVKRLKLFWPVLALLMLVSFSVNAQNKSNVAVNNNTIAGAFSFCDTQTATQTLTGLRFTGTTPLLNIEITSPGITSATVTIYWEYSSTGTGGWTTTLPGTSAQTSAVPGTVVISLGGSTTLNASGSGFYDLNVNGLTANGWFRRVVEVVTNDAAVNATVASNIIQVTRNSSTVDCGTNNFGFNTAYTLDAVAFCPPGGTVNLYGAAITNACTNVTYRWEKNEGSGWASIGTTQNMTNVSVTETTEFRRVVIVGGTDQCTPSTSITATVHDLPADRPMTGPFEICIEKGAVEAGGTYGIGGAVTGETYYWQVSAAYGRIDGPTDQPTVGAIWTTETTAADQAWIQVTITDGNGCQRIIREYVEIYKKKADAGADAVYCAVDPTYHVFNLAASTAKAGSWTYSTSLGGGSVEIGVVTNPATIVTYTFAGSANVATPVFTWTLDEPDFSTPCVDNDDVAIVIYKKPTVSIPAVAASCGATSAQLVVTTNITGTVDADWVAARENWVITRVPSTVSYTWNAVTRTIALVDPLTVPVTFTFEYTITNGTCTTATTTTMAFSPAPTTAAAGPDQTLCGAFNAEKTYVFTNLAGNAPTAGTGVWTLVSRPAGSNIPTIVDPTSPTSQFVASSFGTYVLRWTISTSCGESYDEVAITFLPGIKDVTIVPEEYSVCSLAFTAVFSAGYEYGSLSGRFTPDYSIGAGYVIQKQTWTGSAWTWSNYSGTYSVNPTLSTGTPNQEAMIATNTFNMSEYGKYRVIFTANILDGMGHAPATACAGVATSTFDLYWKPAGIILPNTVPAQICELGSTPAYTLMGAAPRGTVENVGTTAAPVWKWFADTGQNPNSGTAYAGDGKWNQTSIRWYIKVKDGADWVDPAVGAVTYSFSENGRGITVNATVQGTYRFYYEETNETGGCTTTDYQTISFYQTPIAGVARDYTFCGELTPIPTTSAVTCNLYGWGRTTIYRGTVGAVNDNTNLATVDGHWEIHTVAPIGTWTNDDYVSFYNGTTLLRTVTATTTGGMVGAVTQTLGVATPTIEASKPGVYTLRFVANNADATSNCATSYAVHQVTFKDTPKARNLRAITVKPVTGGGFELDAAAHPFTDCYACVGKETWYMLERPVQEWVTGTVTATTPHNLGTFLSTIPFGQSVLWLTTGGGQTGPVVGAPIQGGTIVRTYALELDGKTLTSTVDHHKHHIVQVQWDNVAKGVIQVREHNSTTLCHVVHHFEVNMVEPIAAITGPTTVPAFTENHVYTVPKIEGAVYTWEVAGGTLVASAVNVATVTWGAGPAGVVTVTIANYCHTAIPALNVTIIENTFAGQLKYWNEDETFIPTPYKFHPSNNFDYFYVHLYDVTAHTIATSTVVTPTILDGLTPEIKKIMVDPNNQTLQSYFKFGGLDINKRYAIRVVDGGFYHLADAGSAIPAQNYLSFTYTWNRWDGIGVTATDALAILQMSSATNLNAQGIWWVAPHNATPAYGFFSNAVANVNGDAGVTLTDAYHVLNRVVGTFGQFQNNVPNFQMAARKVSSLPVKTFSNGPVSGLNAANATDLQFAFGRNAIVPAGVNYAGTQDPNNFYWQSHMFTLTEGNNYMNLYMSATGDVNSRFSVPGPGGVTNVVKSATTDLSYTGRIDANVGDEIVIPVRLSARAENLAAVTIGLEFNNSLIEVIGTDYEFATINNKDGVVRVAAVNQNGQTYGVNESILNVRARIIGSMREAELFTLSANTEFADNTGALINVALNTDAISTGAVTSIDEPGFASLRIGNFPNPFSTSTTIEYTLPEAGKVNLVVYNKVGQVVATLVNETQEAGLQTVVLNRADLRGGEGMFIYRITVEGQTRTYTGTGNLMLVK